MLFFCRTLFVLVCCFGLSAGVAQAQWTSKLEAPNAMYVELGGNGGLYSFNYDRMVFQDGPWKGGFRLGLSTSIPANGREFYPIIPVEFLALRGRREKNLELGLGYTHQFTSDARENVSFYYSRIGFRYQPPKGGLVVRFAVTPYMYQEKRRENQYPLVPGFGLSIGKSF